MPRSRPSYQTGPLASALAADTQLEALLPVRLEELDAGAPPEPDVTELVLRHRIVWLVTSESVTLRLCEIDSKIEGSVWDHIDMGRDYAIGVYVSAKPPSDDELVEAFLEGVCHSLAFDRDESDAAFSQLRDMRPGDAGYDTAFKQLVSNYDRRFSSFTPIVGVLATTKARAFRWMRGGWLRPRSRGPRRTRTRSSRSIGSRAGPRGDDPPGEPPARAHDARAYRYSRSGDRR